METNYTIEAKHVSLEFGKKDALKDIHFTLSGPKIFGLLGKNGAGKTTLLSLLASFRKPTSGNILINGEEPFENTAIMQDVGFSYEKDWKEETEKIKGILRLVERYRPNFDKEYAYQLVEKFDLPKNKAIKSFSKGKKSAFNAVIGLAARTPITIFDETYQGMDAPTRELLYQEVLEEQTRYPRMFILSTHLVSEMDYLFDEVLIIHRGELLIQEEYDALVSRGATITGPTNIVDEVSKELNTISTKQLGSTKSVTIFGGFDEGLAIDAQQKGLEIGTVSLQDLFIHLTKEDRNNE